MTLHAILQINFLMVGHTHEDIDGLFGLMASKLKNMNAFTPSDMNAIFALAGKSASTVQEQGSRSGVGIDNGFLPGDGAESRHWNVLADWRLRSRYHTLHRSRRGNGRQRSHQVAGSLIAGQGTKWQGMRNVERVYERQHMVT